MKRFAFLAVLVLIMSPIYALPLLHPNDSDLSAGIESNGIVLTGSSPALAELAATNADGKVTVLE